MSDPPSNDLASYFDRSASTVYMYADRFEHAYARPALDSAKTSFKEKPLPSTFTSIFAFLSFLPVLSFIGFSIFVVVSIFVVALSCALIVSVSIVLFFLSLLALALLTNLFISALFTAVIISTYLFLRLASLVRSQGVQGASQWASEARGRLSHRNTQLAPKFEDTLSESSNSGSGIIIEQEVPIKEE